MTPSLKYIHLCLLQWHLMLKNFFNKQGQLPSLLFFNTPRLLKWFQVGHNNGSPLSLQGNRVGPRESRTLGQSLLAISCLISLPQDSVQIIPCSEHHDVRRSWKHCRVEWLSNESFLSFSSFFSCNQSILWHSYVLTYICHGLMLLYCSEIKYQMTRLFKIM